MAMKNTHYAAEAALLKLLAHPARLAILEALSQERACVCHLEALLGLRQAYLSQQLAVLREGGLVADQREGLNIFYRLARPELLGVLAAARAALGVAVPAVGRPASCPCPLCAGERQQPIALLDSEGAR